MNHRFHTGPRQTPSVFRVGSVTVTKISVGPMDNNAYLLAPKAGPLLLIDAAAEADRLIESLAGRELAAIVTTHRHADHVQALARLAAATEARCWAGRPDADDIGSRTGVVSRPVWSGDRIGAGDIELGVRGLAGHTPGGIALVLTNPSGPIHIFTGDSLFPGGVGRTASATDFNTLLNDVSRELLDPYPDDTVIHPGHGDSTTLGAERPHLAEWRARGW